ncbi:MAG TPA: hypothetical protein VGE97_08610 [Nitrososphaera sp.]
MGHKGIIITKLYATSDTPTGIAMSIHAGLKEFGPKIGKRLRFILDVEKSDAFIISTYKKGLTKWKKANSQQR